MPLDATNLVPNGPVKSADIKQYYDLFTGLMTDQPVTYRNQVNIGGNQGLTTVPLKVFGVTGQTSNLIDLYIDRSQVQPSFGLGSTGVFRWGPGGAAPTDTSMSRIGTQAGHTTDTAGLLIIPRLEVGGSMTVTGNVVINGTINVGGPGGGIPVSDPLNITRINFNPLSGGTFIKSYDGDQTYVHIPKLTVTPGPTALAGLTVNGATTMNGPLTVNSNVAVGGQITAGSLIYSGSYVQGAGRGIFNGYDAGPSWGINVGGNGIASGRFYQRANGGCYCYDVLDFTFGQGIAANTLVQRLGDGGIQVGSIYLPTPQQGGQPAFIAGQTGDGQLRWWPRTAAIGGSAPSLWQQRLTAPGGETSVSGVVSLPWTGYYFAVAKVRGGEFSPGWQLQVDMRIGPRQFWENYGTDGVPSHPQWDDSYVLVFMPATLCSAGDSCYFIAYHTYPYDNSLGDNNNVMYIVFIPTPQYPGG